MSSVNLSAMSDMTSMGRGKKFTANCMNRQLKSHQRNCVQDRLLVESNNRVDRHHMKESKSHRHIQEGIKRDHTVIMTRTPSISEWMRRQQQHMDSWKERERQRVESKHRYSIRQYRVPRMLSLDSSGVQTSMSGSDQIGRVKDDDDDDVSRDLDRPKTSRLRRRQTIHDTRSSMQPRRCRSVAAVEDIWN